ncbi:S8 family serine peptidase [Blastococcus sp. CT_GayMR16]|uniref:S8 family serine peptidase n=1 Tax=Blastococcus sp. CT_GayMR16 TaxID=2559607 RepID=UPI0010739F8C|nr:S8 family serine peptidase [Blastococcus sp. CT_GayMR16]TFV85948.1 peptidase S8 and S53 subtilisin kexin sedolisin [Blastococcus sp. CT_GayMR16]
MISNQRGSTAQDAPGYGVTWGGLPLHARRAMTVAVASLVAAGLAGPTAASAATTASASSADQVSVIVRELEGAGNAPERAVSAFGGSVGRQLDIMGGFTATVPVDRLDALRGVAGVASVTDDAGLALQSTDVESSAAQAGSLYTIANQVTGASAMWDAGYTGKGVDVAVIDSGVVPVDGLTGRTNTKIVYGPDLTMENNGPTKNLDTYGHGTAMSSIIAGRDSAATTVSGNATDFVGMAPDSRIVSIKVADAKGQTDVSQAIAAIDWVVSNRNKNGLNIRVLNMSFGTDGVQDYVLDPLAYAAEQAWHKGIVVVVAVGNEGFGTAKVNNPAYNPYLIAVGSNNANGTATTADDVVSTFSNDGDGTRNPDVVAPGDHVVGLRAAGSYLDTTYPTARIGERLFRGSGTSQAAAVVSGAAALLIQQRPNIKPDQVKALLTGTASAIPGATAAQQGAGLIDLAKAKDAATPDKVQNFKLSTGIGSLELSRGSVHVTVGGREVRGEVDVRGRGVDVRALAAGLRNSANWNGMSWSGMSWSGMSWSGMSWSGMSWSGMSWSGMSWSGMSWSGMSWSGMSWSGMSWSGMSWSGMSWSGMSWS